MGASRALPARGRHHLRRHRIHHGTVLPHLRPRAADGERGLDLRELLRSGATDGEIAAEIAATWAARTDRGAEARAGLADRGVLYQLDSLRADPHREMHTRGG